jgi:hypothetical protein
LSGKLDPQKARRKHSQGGRNDKKPFTARSASKFSAKDDVVRPLQQRKSRNAVQETHSSLDEEDLRIAELEKKLGLGKEKKSKVEDDGLDGIYKVFLN